MTARIAAKSDVPLKEQLPFRPMGVDGQPSLSKADLGDALHAPLLLLWWIVGFGAGAYVGLSMAIEAILGLPGHPLLAAILPAVCLMVVALGIWRLRPFRQWLRPAALGAVFGAATTGPILLLGLEALAEL